MRAFNSTLNIGTHPLKKSRLKPMSKKRARKMPEYCLLLSKLEGLAFHCSELTGKYGELEPHHINGRIGKLLTDPFNIILLLRTEHEYYTNGEGCTRKAKEFLKEFIRPIRIKQGFKNNS